MNLFVPNALLKSVTLKQTVRGVWLFVGSLAVALVVVLEFPALSLWLPGFMKKAVSPSVALRAGARRR